MTDKTKKDLGESGQKIKSLIPRIVDIAWVSEENDKKIVFVSPAMKKISGYSPSEFYKGKGDFWFKKIHKDDLEKVKKAYDNLLKMGKKVDIEYRVKTKKGDWIWGREKATIAKRGKKGATIFGVFCDITLYKNLLFKQEESQKFQKILLDSIVGPAIIVNQERKIVAANKIATGLGARVGGYCWEKFRKSKCILEKDKKRLGKGNVREIKCAPCLCEQVIKNKTERNNPEFHIFNRVWDAYWKYIGKDDRGNNLVLHFAIDITEKKKIQEEMLRLQKIKSLGIVAGGLAHNFNNLLTIILNNVGAIQIKNNISEKTSHLLDNIEKTCLKARYLCNHFLVFSKEGNPIKKVQSAEKTIREGIDFALSGSATTARVSLPADLWKSDFDKEQIFQVIANIILNARQAMDNKGQVFVEAKNITLKNKERPNIISGSKFIQIKVKDKGRGITSKNMTHIFEPYFTTKKNGQGLGLAISQSIIKNHGGLIEAMSKPKEGATFLIYLPKAKSDAKNG